jgi:pimeloyl-ACP methyl ester carboxylesterase
MKITANGIGIHIREQGAGTPCLLFLHYWGGSSRTWDDVISHLSHQHRCIATDHRESGESDAPGGHRLRDLADDAQGVIDAFELDDYVVVGHSMGGKVAQLLAARRQPGLRALVLVAPSPPSPTLLPKDQREAMRHAYDSPESIAFLRDHILTALPLTEAQRQRVITDSLRVTPQAKAAWLAGMIAEDIRAEVARINVPTLVLSGERDQVDPTERLRRELLPHIPGARLQVLPGAGHLPMLETPQELARSIRQFIA